MATFTKVNTLGLDLASKVHNLGSDQLKVALTSSAPLVTNTQLTDLTEISYTNLSTRDITTTSSTQTSGTYKLVLVDLVLTASGAAGPFRYITIYNDTAASKQLLGFYDYGAPVTLADTETFTIDFSAATGALQIV